MQGSLPLHSMQCVLRWVLLQASQRGSRAECFCFHVIYSKMQLKTYIIVWNSVGKVIKIGAICKTQVQASYFKHVLNPRLFGTQFLLCSLTTLSSSLCTCEYMDTPYTSYSVWAYLCLIYATFTYKLLRGHAVNALSIGRHQYLIY